MTIIGAWADRDRALVWADTEFYWQDRLTGKFLRAGGHQLKLVVNRTGAAVGYGSGTMNQALAELVVTYRRSFDELCLELSPFLCTQEKEAFGPRAKEWDNSTCIVAGWSHRFRRALGVVFDLRTNFRPSIVSSFTLPHVGGEWIPNLIDRRDIVSVAREQVRRLQLGKLEHGGGALTVAEVGRHCVSVSAFDLTEGSELQAMPSIRKMEEMYPSYESSR